jgi:TctA family transporter
MTIFFTRPLSSPLMICAVILFLLPLLQMAWRRARKAAGVG